MGESCRPQSHVGLLEVSGIHLLLGFVGVPQVNPLGNTQCQVTRRGCAVCLEVLYPDRHHIQSCHLSPTARRVTDTLARV